MNMAEAQALAEAIKRDFPVEKAREDFIWTAPVAVKVVDCVASLNRPYRQMVEPRVKRLAAHHPSLETCSDLIDLIERSGGPERFPSAELDYEHPAVGRRILGVAEFLLGIQQRFEGSTEADRLRQWAVWAHPGDYITVGVSGFAIAGFQYLRMLLGAETVKPDVHIKAYVERAVGRPVSEIEAVYLLEWAAESCHRSIRWTDAGIWSRAAR